MSSSQAACASVRARTASVVTTMSRLPGGAGPALTSAAFGTVAWCRRRRSSVRRTAGTSSSASTRAEMPTISSVVREESADVVPAAAARSLALVWSARFLACAPVDGLVSAGPAPADDDGDAVGWSVSGAQPLRVDPVTWAAGVGSNGTHPKPARYTSVQACALRFVMIHVLPVFVPRENPNATRAGTPATRTIQAIAAAYCWQKPTLFFRNAWMSEPLVPAWVCRLYEKPCSREK